jgi:DNA-binding transcriptional LysR family regulator
MSYDDNQLFPFGKSWQMKDLEALEVFAKVVATRSMSAAAKSLKLSPAAVSKKISRLEQELGVRLLQRTTRQIAVTEAGQGFHERVLTILASVEDAEAFACGRSAEITGSLKVAAPTSFGRMHIAPHLPEFMRKHSNLSIELVLSDALTDIISDGFDVAIRIFELKDSAFIARRLANVQRVLCASPDYVARHGMPATIEDLANHHCLPAHNGEPWRLEGPDGTLTIRPEGALRTNSSEVIRETVVAGLGIGLRSTWDVGRELSDGRLVRVLPNYQGSQKVTISAIYPTRRFVPMKVKAFVDHLQELYSPTPYWER